MKTLTIEHICRVCGAALHGAALAGEISAVVTDSRRLVPGCLFAAIPGERVDGHDFIAAALKGGAKCALAQRVPEGVEGCVLVVEDTVAALQALAGAYRAEFDLPLIGVTGSVGKTTAKELLSCVLARRFRVHKTEGNFNNDLGVPLTLFGLREEHSAAVVELGVSHPGDMDRIAAIARPTVALYTNIGDAHLEFLGSREGVLAEKGRMVRFLPADGLVVCNGDDPLLAALDCGGRRRVTYGLGDWCDVRAEDLGADETGAVCCTVVSGRTRFPVRVPAFGEHLVYAILAAAAVGLALGMTPEEIAAGAADYVPLGSRGRLLNTEHLTVIDDCYNANPTSTASALRSLAARPGRRVAILGDMRELGARSGELHREIGALARSLGLDLVLTCGTEAAAIAQGAGDLGRHYADKLMLRASLPYQLRPGDTVLVKASRGAAFEELVEVLRHWVPAPPERWDILDSEGRSTGRTAQRGEPLAPGELHRAVHVWLKNAAGQYLISRRAETRPTHPLKYECVGGSVLAGEDSRAAAVREVKEELGLDLDPAAGRLVFTLLRPDWYDVMDAWCFPCEETPDLSAAPTAEVAECAWLTRAELRQLFEEGELVPSLEYVLQREDL